MLSVGAGPLESIGLYDPSSSLVYLRFSNTVGYADTSFGYGQTGAIPIAGDYDADAMDTVGLFDGTSSVFFLRNLNRPGYAERQFGYGEAGQGWKPIAGNWDGATDPARDENCCTIGLYDPSAARFYLRNSNDAGDAHSEFIFGPASQGWLPLAGDWDGDGIDTIGLYNPVLGKFCLHNSNGPGIGDPAGAGYADIEFYYGRPSTGVASQNWIPVAGDWDGDGRDSVGLYDPIASIFYLRNSHTTGFADLAFGYGVPGAGWLPFAGRWTGDKRIQVACPNGGESYERDSDREICWTHTASSGANVQIDLYDNDAFQGTIVSSTANDGSYTWHVPPNLPTGTRYRVGIASTSDPSSYDFSDGCFSITREQRLPDLVLRDNQVAVGRSGASVVVDATVHNEGSADVTDPILVRFRDEVSGTVVSTATINALAAGEHKSVSASWSPGAGDAVLEICADPYDTVRESSNLNNIARVRVSGGTEEPPVIEKVTLQYGPGQFIGAIEAMNRVTVSVTDPDGNSDVQSVTFTLGDLPPIQDTDGSNGWSVNLDMGKLGGDATLLVIAYDKEGNTSAPWTETIHAIGLPSWADAAKCAFRGGSRPHYELAGWIPDDWRLGFHFPKNWALIGGLENAFQAGVLIHPFVGLDGQVMPKESQYFMGLKFTVFDKEVTLFDLSKFGVKFARKCGDPVPAWVPNKVGLGFQISNLEPTFDANLEIEKADLTLKAGVDFNYQLWKKVFGGKPNAKTGIPLVKARAPFSVWGWPMSVEVALNVAPGIDFEATASIVGAGPEGVFRFPTSLTPKVTASLKAKLNLVDVGAASVGVFVQPSLTFKYQLGLLDAQPGWDDDFYVEFGVDLGVELTVGWWTTSASVKVAGPYTFGQDYGKSVQSAQAAGGSQLGILATPDVVTLSDGRQLRVYVGENPDGKSELRYGILGGPGDQPVDPNAAFPDRSPRLAINGSDGTAGAVWTRVQLTQQELEGAELDDVLAAQEICCARFDGTNWSLPVRLTDNAQVDGSPVLAYGPDGRGLAMWVTGAAAHGAGNEIAYSAWNGSTWAAPAQLTANTVGDKAVDLVYTPDGTALAAWLRDVAVDGDNRLLMPCYALWDGNDWSNPEPIPGVGASDISSVRVASLADGRVLAVWAESLNTGFRLRSTVRNATGEWSAPETIATDLPMVDGLQLEASGDQIAFAFFHGTGSADQIFCTSREFRQAGAVWTSPAPISPEPEGDDPATPWQPAGTITSTGDLLVTWANTTSSFAHSLAEATVTAAPRLGFVADSLALAGPSIHTGDPVSLTAKVVNLGSEASEATSVQFYRGFGETDVDRQPVGRPVPLGALLPDGTALVQSAAFNLPPGTNTYFAEMVDIDSIDVTVQSTEPDVTPPTVVLSVPPGGLTAGSQSLTLIFSERMSGLGECDLSLVGVNLGLLPPDRFWLSTQYGAEVIHDQATLWFEGGLPADTYTLRVFDSVEDTAANRLDGDNDGTAGGTCSTSFVVASALQCAEASAATNDASLDAASLAPIVAQAVARWADAGVWRAALEHMRDVPVTIADLPGTLLGATDATGIKLDLDGAGHGWFVDPTPWADEEFDSEGSDGRQRAIDSQALDRIDLLTVVEHELGHTIGLNDLGQSADDLMSGQLGVGIRRSPGARGVDSVLRDFE